MSVRTLFSNTGQDRPRYASIGGLLHDSSKQCCDFVAAWTRFQNRQPSEKTFLTNELRTTLKRILICFEIAKRAEPGSKVNLEMADF
jgi:hypothetical protein